MFMHFPDSKKINNFKFISLCHTYLFKPPYYPYTLVFPHTPLSPIHPLPFLPPPPFYNMNKKKFKEEYNTTAVFNNLTSLMKEEQIINKQKVLLYLKYKTYSELLTKEKEKNKRLEEENKKLNEKKENESKEIENKENLNNLNLNVDLNQLEIYAHKRNCDEGDGEGKDDGDKENRNQNKNQNRRDYELDNSNHNLPFDSLTSLNSLLESKDNKIIELENKVIKLQIIRRLENNKSPLNQPVDFDNSEIINLKSKLEFIKIESERDKKNLNSKLKEFMIKYEETKSKYDSCYSQLKNSLLNLEEIRKFHMSRDVNKIKKIVNLSKEMKGMEYVIKDLENQIYGIEREYLNLCEYFEMHERVNRDRGCNKGRVGEGGRGKDPTSTNPTPTTSTTIPTTPSTDSFYENEISNLLQVCDSLTEQNILLEGQRDDLQSQMDFLKRRNLSLEKDFEMIRLKDSSSFDYIQTYLNKINELSDSIQEICKKLENSNLERNKLTKLNVERISLIEKYKEDLRNKEIEFNILKNNYKEILEENDKKKEDKSNDPIIILCNLCESNPKNVALISCMHTFCDECIESRIKFRNRRCPTCGLPFGSNDVKKVYL